MKMKKRMDEFLHVRSYIDMKSIAADLASADACEQAFFFNTFFDALRTNCEDPFRFNTQLVHIKEQSEHNANLAFEFLGHRGGIDGNGCSVL